ncbi:MAG: hypothetical protein F4Y87_00890 [Synechococcus sp. SB0665_bin_28]|nr:hypothetical protein [Synechococcus sp. SB0665_bin_28]
MRQDGGDAETGFGLEVGAGIRWHHPARGISAQVRGRTLLTHADKDFREQGMALSFAWDPTPTIVGRPFSLSHSMGAAGGMDALLRPVVREEQDAPGNGRHQFETRLAYGLPAFTDRLTLFPGAGSGPLPRQHYYRLLWALAPYAQQDQAQPWQLSLQAERHQSNPSSPAERSLKLRSSLLF